MKHSSLMFSLILVASCGGSGGDGDGASNLPVGSACSSDDECSEGTCLPGPDFPGGHCTQLDCSTENVCPTGSSCVADPRIPTTKCALDCTDDSDCRDGYSCRTVMDTTTCLPPPIAFVPDPDAPFDAPGGVICQEPEDGVARFEFDIVAGTPSYLAVPFVPDSTALTPTTVELPDGSSIPFSGDSSLLGLGAALLGFTNPTLIPQTPGAASLIQEGTHTFEVSSSADEVCFYVAKQTGDSTTLRINLYLAGVPGIEASSAASNDDLQTVLETLNAIFGAAGIAVEFAAFIDVDDEDFSVVESSVEIGELIANSTAPAELLTLNVFLVGDLMLPEGAVIGISQGIPGPAGLHGTSASGVILTAEFLDADGAGLDGASFTGQVMAHEIGHYLGLFHTTESDLATTDPLSDTPNCAGGPAIGPACPDATNLMFPAAVGTNLDLTDQQSGVVVANPLTR